MCDQELNIKFVREIEKYEALYNNTLSDYSRKDVTDKAWQNVAAVVNMSVADCKEKWRNLRTVFIRKIKPLPSGSVAKRRAYYLEEAMQFILPFVKTSALSTPRDLPSVAHLCSASTNEDIGEEETPDDMLSIEIKTEITDFTVPLPPQAPQTMCLDTSSAPILPPRSETNSISVKRLATEVDRSVAEYFQAKKRKLSDVTSTKMTSDATSTKIEQQESLRMFLISLLPELEELNHNQIKLFKRRVLSVLDEITTTSQQQLPVSRYQEVSSPQFDSSDGLVYRPTSPQY
ncbi:uncharacterized protein LOC126879445 [Diabrotica virgifera virgifera]|uniref:Uncharacterized protein LOC114331619 n=1 Tax=Diabrotica virgifera virgifera TaxID=50390 RepID=A0A6P7FLW7_DIAVI|nr:uncharacterized protein LOC126879445 [Diabrotica virgifera virgifera]